MRWDSTTRSGRRGVELQVVALGVLERRDPAPRVVADPAGELHALALQLRHLGLDVALGLEGDHGPAVRVAGALAGVEPDHQAVGVELAPVLGRLLLAEPQGVPVERPRPVHVVDRDPHTRHATRHVWTPRPSSSVVYHRTAHLPAPATTGGRGQTRHEPT